MKNQNHSSKLKTISQYMSFALCVVALHFAFYALRSDKAYADSLSLSVYPSLLQVEAIPPADAKSPLTLENQGNKTINIHVLFKPFRASPKENGEIEYINDPEITTEHKKIFDQIHITDNGIITSNFELGPKQKKNLELQFTIPKNETESDYYFSVIFLASRSDSGGWLTPRSSPQASEVGLASDTSAQKDETDPQLDDPAAQGQNFSVINAGAAVNVLLSIVNKSQPQGVIEEFSAPSFIKSGPVPFTVRIKNTGTHLITAKAILFIKNMFGQTVGRVDLEPDNILAGSIRALTDPQSASDSSQLSNLKAIWPETFLLGPYTASLNIAISDKGQIYNRSIIFIALPIQLILGIILGTLIALAIFLRVRYHLKNDN